MSSAGCNLMISELEGAQRLFWDATRKLNMSVKPIRERFGITDEVLEREFDRQLGSQQHHSNTTSLRN